MKFRVSVAIFNTSVTKITITYRHTEIFQELYMGSLLLIHLIVCLFTFNFHFILKNHRKFHTDTKCACMRVCVFWVG